MKLHTDVNAWPTWQTDISDVALGSSFRASFRWSTYGMAITSTVYAADEGSRSCGAAPQRASLWYP